MSKYDEARKAYEDEAERVRVLLGQSSPAEPYDITGGFVIDEWAWKLAKNPTKATAAQFYEALLWHGEASGWDDYASAYFPPPKEPTHD